MSEVAMWLVEEHVQTFEGDIEIPLHVLAPAVSAQEAFEDAERRELLLGRVDAFFFSANELEETVKGYLWEAADGSMVKYEVRKLG